MSFKTPARTAIKTVGVGITLLALACVPYAAAQYPGQVTSSGKNAPILRAVAVLEWTGDAAHPKTGRLVPICIWDGQNLQDADVYLARPAPIALETGVEYQLFQNGKPLGLFDVERAGQQQGTWVGLGRWRPLPAPKPAPAQVAKIDAYDDAQSDTPVLHRKRQGRDSDSGSSTASSEPAANAPAPDPDRPTLHKDSDATDRGSDQSANSGQSGDHSSGGTSSPNPAPASGGNGPTLHRSGDASGASASSASTHSSSGSSSQGSTSASEPDRPKLKKQRNEEDEAYVSDVATVTDPSRPHLFRGQSNGFDEPLTATAPSLSGLPADMQQQIAVSDAVDRPVHEWSYAWANPGDEAKMKAAVEDLARTALGLTPPPAPPQAKPAAKPGSKAHAPVRLALPPASATLADEQFRVFELAYGSGVTMVLSARIKGAGADEKFVTLIAQPDLYGNVAVLIKNVTDAAHLDATPRLRLVDAVDALADNRGELLFELRGATQRQFALYRVLRGEATRIFVSDTDPIIMPQTH